MIAEAYAIFNQIEAQNKKIESYALKLISIAKEKEKEMIEKAKNAKNEINKISEQQQKTR